MRDHKIHINYTVVAPSHRNQGIHTDLRKEVIKFAMENNCVIITSNIKESNVASLKSGKKAGFYINDNVELYYPNGERKIPIYYKL